MDQRYELYCMKDPFFYDRLDPSRGDRVFPALQVTPAGWNRVATSGWTNFHPEGARIPQQGWKIHVSGTTKNAENIVEKVWNYCTERDITFKVVPGPREWRDRNDKYADRAGSGKLVTIYPCDSRQLETILTELGDMLRGEPGPYILSDVRWQDGPLYVRYGAFRERRIRDSAGREILAIDDPHGNLVDEPRAPVFNPPDWVDIPDILRPAVKRRAEVQLDGFPYDFVRAMHYSNGGGVYEARDKRTGQKVAVKEGRLHAGIDKAGRDAVVRLRRERRILERLSGLNYVPRLIDYVTIEDHEFLVEEFLEGEALHAACTRRNPLIMAGVPSAEDLDGYAAWAISVWQRTADAVRQMHARGVIFGDIHLYNVFISDDGESVKLIDFEAGWFTDEDGRQLIANPGFAAPAGTRGTDVDEYALSRLKLALFAPVTSLALIDDGKPAQLAALIADTFGVSHSWLRESAMRQKRALDGGGTPTLVGRAAHEIIVSASAAILESATPDREDRLFPGDIAQFLAPGAGIGLAHGAAGVLWALHRIGARPFPDGEQWLLEGLRRDEESIEQGFYHGRHGIAYALWDLGYKDEAQRMLKSLADEFDPGHLDHSLLRGLSGIGLNWLRFAGLCGDDLYLRYAVQAGEEVAATLGSVDSVPELSGGSHGLAGLMHGSSGKALLFIALYESTGQQSFLHYAEVALRQDLRRCVHVSDGGLHVNEGSRGMPYLAEGSVGIGFVLDRFLRHCDVLELRESLIGIKDAAGSMFYLFPELFRGMAGPILFNATTGNSELACRQVLSLDWHVTGRAGEIAFPGTQLLRLSMDLATGSAGVLLAMAAAQQETGRKVGLPFLNEDFPAL